MWLFVLIILTDKIHLVSQQQAGTLCTGKKRICQELWMTKGYKLLGYKLADNIFYCLHHREIITLRGTRTQVQLRSTMACLFAEYRGARQRTSGQR